MIDDLHLKSVMKPFCAALICAAVVMSLVERTSSAQPPVPRARHGLPNSITVRGRQSREGDDYAIYALLLANQLHLQGKRFVLQSETDRYHAQIESIDLKLDRGYANNPGLVYALHNYNATNRQAANLHAIEGAERSLPVSKAGLIQLFKHGSWQNFYKKYPDAIGLASLARPGYSKDGRTAIGYCSFSRGGKAGFGLLIWLKREHGHWLVVKSISGWES
jgi:hypothetical protein